MDFIEVEGKTYEEAVRKACAELNAEEKELDIDVTEVDTKGILGLLGTKKIRITARRREENSPQEYGEKFLKELSTMFDLSAEVKITEAHDRIMFVIQCDGGDVLIGKDGENLDALQYLLRLAVAKRFKEGMKILVDINGYRERRRKALTVMAKRLADKAKRTGRRMKTDPLNPYERRIIHTLFKHNKFVTTKSEGEGHTKKVVISPTGNVYGRR
jgi:spoIIIJ-associated protein